MKLLKYTQYKHRIGMILSALLEYRPELGIHIIINMTAIIQLIKENQSRLRMHFLVRNVIEVQTVV